MKIQNIQIDNYSDIDKPIKIEKNYIDTLYKAIQLPSQWESYINRHFFSVTCVPGKEYQMCQCSGDDYMGLPVIEFTLRETKYKLSPYDYTLMPIIDKKNFQSYCPLMINQTGYFPSNDPVLGRAFFNKHALAYYIDREGFEFMVGVTR